MASAIFMTGPASAYNTMSRRGERESLKIDRHGLGIAKKKWRVEQQQHAGQQDRPKRINVLHRVEAYTAKAPCSIVAEEMSDNEEPCAAS